MNKKIIVIGVSILVLLIIGGFIFFLLEEQVILEEINPQSHKTELAENQTKEIDFLLDVQKSALPSGVSISDIKKTALNVYDFYEGELDIPEDEIPVIVLKLEPSGTKFIEPVQFAISINSTRAYEPTIFLVGDSGREIVKNTISEFNEAEHKITVSGEIIHFSYLVAGKNKADETAGEFVERAKEHTNALKDKAERMTFDKERGELYKKALDKAEEYEAEGLKRFPNDIDKLPRLGENAYGKADSLTGYQEYALKDLDRLINAEEDPFKRMDLVKDRMDKTFDIHKKWLSGEFDERKAPRAGGDALGETSLLVGEGDAITKQIVDLINNENNPAKELELKKKLFDIVNWLIKEGESGAYSEGKVPRIEKWERLLDGVGMDLGSPDGIPPLDAGGDPPPYILCLFDEYIECRDGQFDLQGCIDACPFVSVNCAEVGTVGDECLITDEACSNSCLDEGQEVAKECARKARCTMDEIDVKLRAMYPPM